MLVKALRLWNKDVKLTADELRAQTPMVGWLRYDAGPYGGRDGRGAMTCLLMPRDANLTEPLVQLYSARIKIDKQGIRIRGEEDEWRRKERTSYKQVLWCWPYDGVEVHTYYAPPRGYETAGRRALA